MKEYKDVVSKSDSIISVGRGSSLQHGKQNDRIYLMKLAEEDVTVVLDEISRLLTLYDYSKVICKVSAPIAPLFLAEGYMLEGYIPGFYNGEKGAFFLSKFLSAERLSDLPKGQLETLYELQQAPIKEKHSILNSAYTVRKLNQKDIPLITALYTETFESYPFPIYDPGYIADTMADNIQYFGAFNKEELAALASSEVDFEAMNAEMTDFATSKTHAGHHLSCLLLEMMEYEMQRQGITTLYTIARLESVAMNKTFVRFGFNYVGTLLNNTNIAGKIESMNLYYKHI
ncbi:putative beta-lysine N-acetyltransferase [Bacteroides nordii]|uniref:putative beta-lysine N-acetyltransferase n=1 Tax=Bacteroides nordii TaxID=291645 RepID=UPI0035204D7E